MTKLLSFDAPQNFSFKATVYSHGWSQLAPFDLDAENWKLKFVFDLNENEKPVAAVLYENDGQVFIEIKAGSLSKKASEKIIKDARHILQIDENLADFYKQTGKNKHLKWIAEKKAGRLLRSPTVFEDLVKTLCTTNCSWALTKKMVANMVDKLGASTATGEKAFPTAAAMAEMPVEFYREEIRAGYRSQYFAELAEKVALGIVNPESWLESELSTKELKREMKSIKGVGDYAAENLLKLVGRYDGLALDSWLRSQFYKKHNGEQICDDKTIAQHYEKYGSWCGLAIWLDMSERRHDY